MRFKINDIWYEYYTDIDTAMTYFVDDAGRILISITKEGYLLVPKKDITISLGKFYVNDYRGYWCFEFLDDPNKLPHTTGSKDLIKFQIAIFKKLLREGVV